MEEKHLTYREYAAFARQTAAEVARDCEVDVFRAIGPGGQGVNTTDSAVRMRHVPTGIVATARESRSQFQNRASCVRKLQEEFRRRAVPPKVRHATKVPASQRRRRLKDKRMRSELKSSRRRITGEE